MSRVLVSRLKKRNRTEEKKREEMSDSQPDVVSLLGLGAVSGCLLTYFVLRILPFVRTAPSTKLEDSTKSDKKKKNKEKYSGSDEEDDDEDDDDDDESGSDEEDDDEDDDRGGRGESKLVLCARMDLKMGPGKIAAQVLARSIDVYRSATSQLTHLSVATQRWELTKGRRRNTQSL